MLVSHIKRFIYTKTIKTAGTSVELFLEPWCHENPHHRPEHRSPEIVSSAGIIGSRAMGTSNITFYNHMPASRICELLGEDIWNSYFKFCTVRNPFDKVVSWFWFREIGRLPDKRSYGGGARNQPDFGDVRVSFRSWLLSDPDLPQDIAVYTIDGSTCVDRFLRYERLQDDVNELCSDLSLEAAPLPTLKSQYRRRPEAFQEYYDQLSAEVVKRTFEVDFDLLEYDAESWRF